MSTHVFPAPLDPVSPATYGALRVRFAAFGAKASTSLATSGREDVPRHEYARQMVTTLGLGMFRYFVLDGHH